MSYKQCYNCGADKRLHHYKTMQCPKNGREEIRFDKLTGTYYHQQWVDTTFEDAAIKKAELAVPQLIKALKAIKTHLEHNIKGGFGSEEEEKILQQINTALKDADIC